MSETILDYDKIIWEVFAIGVTASIIILYNVVNLESKIPKNFDVLVLILGFSILIYSSILFLGYNFKKSIFINSDSKNKIKEKLEKSWYPRARWMAEIILLFIIILYFKAFTEKWIPIVILLITIVICSIANCCAKKKVQKNNWVGYCNYFKSYFRCQ
ncbi:hypothetical protein HYV49_04365 [Candidatus Pacearchaeota archaeon]|nr:hypothetical protein [Candidatus Pacearchaeota archaeon]